MIIFQILLGLVMLPVMLAFKLSGRDEETIRFWIAAILSTAYIIVMSILFAIAGTWLLIHIVIYTILMFGQMLTWLP